MKNQLTRSLVWSMTCLSFLGAGATVPAIAEEDDGDRHFFGSLDLRPSWATSRGDVYVGNEIGLEYRASRYRLGYAQGFSNSVKTGGTAELLSVGEGCLRGDAGSIASFGRDTALTYEAKLGLPTNTSERDAGYLGSLRNYLKLSHQVTPALSVEIADAVILPAYGVPSALREGEAVASPRFENRLSAGPRVSLFRGKLSLAAPVHLKHSRHASAGTAQYSGKWGHALWLVPEVNYAVSNTTSLGVAYYRHLSGGHANAVSGIDYDDNNVFQFILQQQI